MALRTSIVRLTDRSRRFAGQVVHRNGRWRGPAGDDGFRQHAEPARKALAGDAALVEIQVLERGGIVAGDAQGAILDALAAPGVAQGVRLGVIEQHAVAKRARIVRARRQLGGHLYLAAVEQQHASGAQAGQVHAAFRAVDIVDVQLVEHQRPVLAARIESHRLEPELVRRDVHRPVELAPVEIEAQDAVEARGGRGTAVVPRPRSRGSA